MGYRYPPREDSLSDCNSIHTEYGSNNSHRSYPRSSSSSDTRSTNVNYTNVQNPNIQYQTRMGSSPSHYQYPQSQYPQPQYPQSQYSQSQYPQSQYPQSQYPQSYAARASNYQQQLPLTQQTLYANHTQDVNPQNRQQRDQQQYASRVAAAESVGIDTTNPMFAPVARERPQSSRPMEAYAAEPDPRYLAVARPQASRRQDHRGTRL